MRKNGRIESKSGIKKEGFIMKINSMRFTMGDKVQCPRCYETNTRKYTSDTTTFNQGRGVVNTDYHCSACDSNFSTHTNFNYQITEQESCL